MGGSSIDLVKGDTGDVAPSLDSDFRKPHGAIAADLSLQELEQEDSHGVTKGKSWVYNTWGFSPRVHHCILTHRATCPLPARLRRRNTPSRLPLLICIFYFIYCDMYFIILPQVHMPRSLRPPPSLLVGSNSWPGREVLFLMLSSPAHQPR